MDNRVTCIEGLWLRTNGEYIEVLIQQAGKWIMVIREENSNPSISHTIPALAIDKAVDAAMRSWEGRR